MGQVSRAKGSRKIHVVSESRKLFRGLEFTGSQLLNANALSVVSDSCNRFNPLAESEHAAVGIAEGQRARCAGQPHVNFDPGGDDRSDPDSHADCLRVNAEEGRETQHCANGAKRFGPE